MDVRPRFGRTSSGDIRQSVLPTEGPHFAKLCVWKSFKGHLGQRVSRLVLGQGISALELQFPWRCGGLLDGCCWGSCSSPQPVLQRRASRNCELLLCWPRLLLQHGRLLPRQCKIMTHQPDHIELKALQDIH